MQHAKNPNEPVPIFKPEEIKEEKREKYKQTNPTKPPEITVNYEERILVQEKAYLLSGM